MPYYGDYYAGDPGLFSFAKKALGGIVKSILPGPVRTVLDIGSKVLGRRSAGGVSTPVTAPVATFQASALSRAAPRVTRRRRRKSRLKFGSAAWRRKYLRR